MSARVKLELKGLEEYLERVAAAGNDVDVATAAALVAGADVALVGMQRRVAVLTGDLKSHLSRSEPQRDGNRHWIYVGLKGDGKTMRKGLAQEYGTSSMQAHPYIRPTLTEDGRAIRAAERDKLKELGVLPS